MKTALKLVLALLVVGGLGYEFFILLAMGLTSQQWGQIGLSWGILLGVYVVPLLTIASYWLKKQKQPRWLLILALLAGMSGIGSLAGWLNFQLLEQLKQLLGHDAILDQWAASITPPVVEEFFKLTIAILLIVVFSLKNRSSWLATGFGVGLGFQLMEDHSYLLASIIDGKGTPVQVAVERLQLAYASHWLLTAVMVLGLTTLLFTKQRRASYLPYLWLLAPVCLHAFVNSPIVSHNMWLMLLFMLMSWGLLWTTVFTSWQENRTK